MKTKKSYYVIVYKIKSNGCDLIEVIARFTSVERCNRYLDENADWLSKKYFYYHITESVTVRYGRLTDYLG